MNDLVLSFGGFVAMGAICTLLERLWPERADQPAWRTDSWTDVGYFTLRMALSGILVVITGLIGTSLPGRTPVLAGTWPFGLQLLCVLLLTDLLSYWVHRLHHLLTPLWWMHAVHHAPRQIDWLVAARVHPVELVLGKVVSTFPVYLLGFEPDVFALTVPAMATYSLFLHSNLKWGYGVLGYVIASPAFHRWHHSSEAAAIDRNYAQLFSFYDYLFATAYFPRERSSTNYGLSSGETVPEGIVPQLFYPLRRWLGREQDAMREESTGPAEICPAGSRPLHTTVPGGIVVEGRSETPDPTQRTVSSSVTTPTVS
jgi:sterol desaturase/sphingolipid hydroxylase (fatty acid hydroxylase superfamily)